MNPNIVSVPLKSTLPSEPVGKLIYDQISNHDKNSIALIETKPNLVYTFGDLATKSLALAKNLRKLLKIAKNDHIAIIGTNSAKFLIASLAGLYLAAPLHLLNPGFTLYELDKSLNLSKPKIVFCSKLCLESVQFLSERYHFIENIVLLDHDGTEKKVQFFDNLVQNGDETDFNFEQIGDFRDQVAYICNTSGTTGLPKGAMIPQENLRLNLVHCLDQELYPKSENPCIIVVVPFYHVHGFTVAYCALYQGTKTVLMDKFEPKSYLESIERHKVTKLFIVPSLGDFLANSPTVNEYDLTSVEEIYLAAGVLKRQTEEKILQKFEIFTVRQVYGLTELAALVTSVPKTGGKPGSCGKLSPGHQIKVVDPQTGQILGFNQPGELHIKGVGMTGYVNDPENTRAAMDDDGFVRTGDIGYFDEDYDFFIVDRLKDLIKYKSFQVPPMEIEEVLMRHEGVKDCAVVGKPDDRFGELPVAFVVKKEGVDVREGEIVDHVARFLCVEKRLHGGVKFVGEIPRTAMGKVLRKELRNMI